MEASLAILLDILHILLDESEEDIEAIGQRFRILRQSTAAGLRAAPTRSERSHLGNPGQYHNPDTWIAYWDRFGRPPSPPRYGGPQSLTIWWVDPDREAALAAAGGPER